MTHHLGGKVEKATHREYGKATITVQRPSQLFSDLPTEQIVWMSHGDLVTKRRKGLLLMRQAHLAQLRR